MTNTVNTISLFKGMPSTADMTKKQFTTFMLTLLFAKIRDMFVKVVQVCVRYYSLLEKNLVLTLKKAIPLAILFKFFTTPGLPRSLADNLITETKQLIRDVTTLTKKLIRSAGSFRIRLINSMPAIISNFFRMSSINYFKSLFIYLKGRYNNADREFVNAIINGESRASVMVSFGDYSCIHLLNADTLNWVNERGVYAGLSVYHCLAMSIKGRQYLTADNFALLKKITPKTLNAPGNPNSELCRYRLAFLLACGPDTRNIFVEDNYALGKQLTPDTLNYIIPLEDMRSGESVALYLTVLLPRLLAEDNYALNSQIAADTLNAPVRSEYLVDLLDEPIRIASMLVYSHDAECFDLLTARGCALGCKISTKVLDADGGYIRSKLAETQPGRKILAHRITEMFTPLFVASLSKNPERFGPIRKLPNELLGEAVMMVGGRWSRPII